MNTLNRKNAKIKKLNGDLQSEKSTLSKLKLDIQNAKKIEAEEKKVKAAKAKLRNQWGRLLAVLGYSR